MMSADPKNTGAAGFSDKDEQALYEAVERGEFRSSGDVEARRAYWKQVAENTLNVERTRISLSVPAQDLARIKAKALRLGIPYQTLINAVLHQIATGERKLEQ